MMTNTSANVNHSSIFSVSGTGVTAFDPSRGGSESECPQRDRDSYSSSPRFDDVDNHRGSNNVLNTLGNCLSETESETIILRNDLQKLLRSTESLVDASTTRVTSLKDEDKDSVQNDSNLSSFTKMQYEDIHKAYTNMAAKLANTESTVQSLKLHFCNIQAKQDLKSSKKQANESFERNDEKAKLSNNAMKTAFENELKKLTQELDRYRLELKTALDTKRKLLEENQSLKTHIEVNNAARLSDTVRLEQTEIAKNKASKRTSELKMQLEREMEMRESLEKSHSSLIVRLEDMEALLEQERAQVVGLILDLSGSEMNLSRDNVVTALKRQVQKTESEYQAMKRDFLALREEVSEEHRLRANTEEAMQFLKQQAEMNGDKVGELMSERTLIDSALVQWKKDYLTMENELKEKNRLIKELEDKSLRMTKEVTQLQAALKKCSEEFERAKESHAEEIGNLNRQFNTAIEKQKEATSTAAVDLEKLKCRNLQEKIAELGSQMTDYERQQAVDTSQLKDQLKQKDAEVRRAKAECEELRKIQERALKDKETLLNEVNKTVDQLTADRVKLEYALEESRLELAKVTQSRDHQEAENVRLLEEMSSLEIRQGATDQLQSQILELTDSKMQLSHDNENLKRKVRSRDEEVESLGQCKLELSVLKRQNAAYEAQFTKLNTEMNCIKLELQKSQALVKQYRDKMAGAEEESMGLRKIKEELLSTKHENEDMKTTIEKLLEDNRTLKSALECTSTELDTKLNIIKEIEQQRAVIQKSKEDEKKNLEELYEDKLEVLRIQHNKDRELLLNRMKKEENSLKKSRDEALHRLNESSQLVAELRQRMGSLESDLNKQKERTGALKAALDQSQKQKQVIAENAEQLKYLTEKIEASEKDKKQYMKQNLEQARTISSFVEQTSQLETELQDLASLNEQTANIAKHYEGVLTEERKERQNMEHKLAHLNSRCKELEGHLIDVTLNSSRQLATAVSNVSNANESSVNEKPVTTAKSGSNTVENAAYPRTTHAYTSQYYSGFPKVQSSRSDGKMMHSSRIGDRPHLETRPSAPIAARVDNDGSASPMNSSLRSVDLENERQKAMETTRRARQMIQESRETMRKLSERMCLLEDDYPPRVQISSE